MTGSFEEGCVTVFKKTPTGALTTLYSFSGADGNFPAATLVQGTDGNFYGATQRGGTSDNGTIFKITPAGVLTTLHSFNGTDGAGPVPRFSRLRTVASTVQLKEAGQFMPGKRRPGR